MRVVNSIVYVLSVTATLFSGELDQGSRKVLLDHLNQSSSEFRESLTGLTPEQWSYKPAPDVWSIAECAEHIALSEDLLRDLVQNKVLTGAASPERVAERKLGDDKVLK